MGRMFKHTHPFVYLPFIFYNLIEDFQKRIMPNMLFLSIYLLQYFGATKFELFAKKIDIWTHN